MENRNRRTMIVVSLVLVLALVAGAASAQMATAWSKKAALDSPRHGRSAL